MGRGRSTTPALATQPVGYSTYWQYTTALAFSVLAVTNPVISSAANAIESFIFASIYALQMIAIERSAHFDLDQTSLVRTKRLLRVCAVERRRFPVGARPTRQPLQPEATGAVMEATKWLKPLVSGSRIGDRASVQAAT